MKGRFSLPAGWTDYLACGEVIPGTRFVAFKTPLRGEYNSGLREAEKEGHHSERFSARDCAREVYDRSRGQYRLGLVLNLTFTDKYYNPADFDRERVHFGKIMCPGHEIPNDSLVRQFQDSVLNYFYDYPDPSLVVGVHCTHGVNRTGYMIARFLIQIDGWPVDDAIAAVGKARGHPIERENYLAHLHNLHKPSSLYPKKPKTEPKTGGTLLDKDGRNETQVEENGSGLQIFDGTEDQTPDRIVGAQCSVDNAHSVGNDHDSVTVGNDHSSDKQVEVESDYHNSDSKIEEDSRTVEDVSESNSDINSVHEQYMTPQEGVPYSQDSSKRTLEQAVLEPAKVPKTA